MMDGYGVDGDSEDWKWLLGVLGWLVLSAAYSSTSESCGLRWGTGRAEKLHHSQLNVILLSPNSLERLSFEYTQDGSYTGSKPCEGSVHVSHITYQHLESRQYNQHLFCGFYHKEVLNWSLATFNRQDPTIRFLKSERKRVRERERKRRERGRARERSQTLHQIPQK